MEGGCADDPIGERLTPRRQHWKIEMKRRWRGCSMPVGLDIEGKGNREMRRAGEKHYTKRGRKGEGNIRGREEEKDKQRERWKQRREDAREREAQRGGAREKCRCNQRSTPISTLERFPSGKRGIVKGSG